MKTFPLRSWLPFSEAAWLRPLLNSSQQETLKWLAVFLMTLGYLNQVLLNDLEPFLFYVSRASLPLFAFLVAYNLTVREVKVTRYLWPLALFAFVSQLVYTQIWGGYTLNVLFTLCFGVLYLALYELVRRRLNGWWSHALLALLFFIPALQVEFGPAGVALVPLLVGFLKRPSIILLVLVGLVILVLNAFAPYAWSGLLALPLVYMHTRFDISLPRTNTWLFYSYYPAHLFVLHKLALYLV
jgi:hypothetical protein